MGSSRALIWLCSLFFASCGVQGCGSTNAGTIASPIDGVRREDLVARGDGHVRRGDGARAEQYFALAWKNGWDRHEILPRLLDICLAAGRLRSALEYVERALGEDPTDLQLRQLQLTLRFALGDVPQEAKEPNSLTREERVRPGDEDRVEDLGLPGNSGARDGNGS